MKAVETSRRRKVGGRAALVAGRQRRKPRRTSRETPRVRSRWENRGWGYREFLLGSLPVKGRKGDGGQKGQPEGRRHQPMKGKDRGCRREGTVRGGVTARQWDLGPACEFRYRPFRHAGDNSAGFCVPRTGTAAAS